MIWGLSARLQNKKEINSNEMTQFSPSQGSFQAPGREVGSPAVSHLRDHTRVFSYVGYLEVLSQDLKQKMKEVKSNFHKVFTSHWSGSSVCGR